MNETLALIRTEAKLLFREPISWLAAIALPSAVLLIFGTLFSKQGADPSLGGLRFIDVFVPSLVVITVGTLGIQTLPIRLATYREKGVLRRLSTTPAHPLRLLTAQLLTYLATALPGCWRSASGWRPRSTTPSPRVSPASSRNSRRPVT